MGNVVVAPSQRSSSSSSSSSSRKSSKKGSNNEGSQSSGSSSSDNEAEGVATNGQEGSSIWGDLKVNHAVPETQSHACEEQGQLVHTADEHLEGCGSFSEVPRSFGAFRSELQV